MRQTIAATGPQQDAKTQNPRNLLDSRRGARRRVGRLVTRIAVALIIKATHFGASPNRKARTKEHLYSRFEIFSIIFVVSFSFDNFQLIDAPEAPARNAGQPLLAPRSAGAKRRTATFSRKRASAFNGLNAKHSFRGCHEEYFFAVVAKLIVAPQ